MAPLLPTRCSAHVRPAVASVQLTVCQSQARLKVNGKFECLGLAGSEVKKGSREDNFSVDPHERLKLKYYHAYGFYVSPQEEGAFQRK